MISIIMPTYNRSEMLKSAIKCIEKQTYKDYELLIINDNSTDDTFEKVQPLLSNHRIKYFQNTKNMGPGYNRHFGFLQASGEYIIFMDDDDYYVDENFFQNAIEAFYNNKNANLAFVTANSYIEYVNSQKKVPTNIGHTGFISGIEFLTKMDFKYKKPLSTFTTIFSKEILTRADLKHMAMVNDYAIYMRALLYGNAYILKDQVGVYRKHGNNISTHIDKDFLIENLNERVWIKKHLSNRISYFTLKRWWNRQMTVPLSYYLIGTRPNFRNCYDVIKWIIKNSGIAPFLWLQIIYCIIKAIIHY